MKVANLLHPGFTALDVVGTLQVLIAAPAMHSVFVAAEADTVVDDTATDQPNTRIGSFWRTSTWETGQTSTHHAGQTGGYASWLGIDRHARRAVIVLSDVANDAGDLGSRLLADPTKGTS